MLKVMIYNDDTYSVDMMLSYVNLFEHPIKKVKMSSLTDKLKDKCWESENKRMKHFSPLDVIENPKKYKEDMKRINSAELKFPIFMSDEGWVIDGMHRITKSFLLKKKLVKAYIFDKKILKKFLLDGKGNSEKAEKTKIHLLIEKFYEEFEDE
jgi:hypothetical protein